VVEVPMHDELHPGELVAAQGPSAGTVLGGAFAAGTVMQSRATRKERKI
jgi:hypothetical protein